MVLYDVNRFYVVAYKYLREAADFVVLVVHTRLYLRYTCIYLVLTLQVSSYLFTAVHGLSIIDL